MKHQVASLLFAGAMALAFGGQANAQAAFTITSSSFKDGERLAVKMAGNNKSNPNCVGENVSPALSWANPPEGTKSYALMMFDPEGRPPGGVSHWVAYGIPVSVTGFAEGEASKQTDKYVGGKSLMGLPHYFGPCTPPGSPHHYTFTLIATDLEPTALQPGMTRDERMTRSPGPTAKYLCSPAAMRARAEFGSPWLPVERITCRSGGIADRSSSETTTPSGSVR